MSWNGIDDRLRGEAPQAADQFVSALSTEIPAVRRRRSSTMFLAALTVFAVGSLASFGGVSYAAEGAAKAADAAKAAIAKTSASDQYGKEDPVTPAPEISDGQSGVKGQSASGGGGAPAQGSLPFTGLSLLGTLGLGAALIVGGLALRRRENDQ